MTYFTGAYWMQREESQAACALRISNFIIEISKLDPSLSHWFKKGANLREALRTELPIDKNGLKPLLRVQRRDVGNEIIPELGYSFSAWNGNLSNMGASISVMCGGLQQSRRKFCCSLFRTESIPIARFTKKYSKDHGCPF